MIYSANRFKSNFLIRGVVASGGTEAGKTFLGAASTGEAKLFDADKHADDGNWLQRWKFEEGDGDWYNIKLYNGIGDKIYLSTGPQVHRST